LHSRLQYRSCDAEEFLRSELKTGTSTDRGSELLCGGNALLDATTPIRDYFRVADNQGVIVLGLKSKCWIHPLLRVARHASTRPHEWGYDVRAKLESPFCLLCHAMGARVSPRAV